MTRAREPTRTSAAPKIIAGLEWTCWSTGVMQTEWRATRTDGAALVVQANEGRTVFRANVAGVWLPTKFRTQVNAMKAAAAQKDAA